MVQLLNWTSQVFGIIGVAAGKVSVSALLLGIIRLTELKWQRVCLWTVTGGLAGAIAVACSILMFAQCRPAAALWDTRVEGTCIDPKVMSGFGTFTGCQFFPNPLDYSHCFTAIQSRTRLTTCRRTAFNTFADASLALIPTTIFWHLRTGTLEKIQLSIVFALNILTSICSGIKTQYLAALANRTDLTWATFDIFAWVTAELFLMIVCGTIPTLHPLLLFVRRVVGSLSGSGRSEVRDEVVGREGMELGEVKVMAGGKRLSVRTVTKEGRKTSARGESCDSLV
jgi:hypothetical protein